MPTKTPAEKLAIKPGTSVWSSHPDRLGILGALPDGVAVVEDPGASDTALAFADDAASIRASAAAHATGWRVAGTLWVAYPKGGRTDLKRDTLWPILAEHGLRPNGQVALDDMWTAMRFRPLRDGEHFSGGR